MFENLYLHQKFMQEESKYHVSSFSFSVLVLQDLDLDTEDKMLLPTWISSCSPPSRGPQIWPPPCSEHHDDQLLLNFLPLATPHCWCSPSPCRPCASSAWRRRSVWSLWCSTWEGRSSPPGAPPPPCTPAITKLSTSYGIFERLDLRLGLWSLLGLTRDWSSCGQSYSSISWFSLEHYPERRTVIALWSFCGRWSCNIKNEDIEELVQVLLIKVM